MARRRTAASLRLAVILLVALGATPHGSPATQDTLENSVLQRAVAASRKALPEWRFVVAIVNAPGPLMPEQLGVAGGTWYKSSDPSSPNWYRSLDESSDVNVGVYTVATEDAADAWLFRHSHGGVAKGWVVEPYEFGDRATMATYADPRGFIQYGTWIRKGRFLVSLSARSREDIETFATIMIKAASGAAAEREKH